MGEGVEQIDTNFYEIDNDDFPYKRDQKKKSWFW